MSEAPLQKIESEDQLEEVMKLSEDFLIVLGWSGCSALFFTTY